MATAIEPVHRRAKPGAKGGGRFFHIEVRSAKEFVTFRVQVLSGADGIERVAGRHADGTWDTAKWLIGKSHAHVEAGRLVPDSEGARKMFRSLASPPVQIAGDRFRAKPRRKIPESAKPTLAMRRAQLANIKKAQAALRKRRAARTGTKRRAARPGTKRRGTA